MSGEGGGDGATGRRRGGGEGATGRWGDVRVLHVIRPAAGGMVSHVRLLCPGLARAGVEVVLVAPRSVDADSLGIALREPLPDILGIGHGPCDASLPSQTLPGNLGMSDADAEELLKDLLGDQDASVACAPTITAYIADIAPRFALVRDLRVARLIGRAAIGYDPDLIHGHGLRGAWIATLAARRADMPFVFTAHNLAPQNPGVLARMALGYVIGRARTVICVSRAVAESLAPFGLRSDRVEVIPNGIDLAEFDERPTTNDQRARPLVVSLGRLSREKGFDVLIGAAKLVPDTDFVIAGEGTERSALADLIGSDGLLDRVTLPGRVDDVPAFFDRADVVAVPSREEGQGIVALEAMAARKPVVASRAGGLAETVVNGVTGMLVPPDDPEALASALSSMLSDEAMRARMGAAGRRRVGELYTAERMVERTIEVYRQALQPK